MAATGHMNPTLPLVAELKAKGCQVSYFVDAKMRGVVEAAGAEWHPFRYPDEKDGSNERTGTLMTLDEAGIEKYVPPGTPEECYAPLPFCQIYNAEIVLPRLLEDLKGLKTNPISAIVYDPFLAFAKVAAHELQVPAISTITVAGPGTMTMPVSVYDDWESKAWVQGPRKEIMNTYGVDVLADGMLMEFISKDLNLVTTSDHFFAPPGSDRQRERFGKANFKCVGPLINHKIKRIENANVNAQKSQDGSSGLLGRVDDALKSGRRLVYISLGTVATSDHFWTTPFGSMSKGNVTPDCTGQQLCRHVFRTCFEVLGSEENLENLIVVMAIARSDALEGLPPAPSNFIIQPTVPQLEILRRSSVFLTHGGANSMHESLSLGVPMIVVPIFGDQPMNGDSVAANGAGFSFRHPLETLTQTSLSKAFHEILAHEANADSFHARVEKISLSFAEAGGVTKAAELILEEAVSRKKGTGTYGGA
eukprot:TRINITY_DN2059_c2_g2_i9.p1 TRINITY_DN2059_c2_g2~~TRINITY_DN2059_c2_g2_i9.p1  ORF type:complete len:522 (-),score=91.09 TRINITY_DN2059_c2_g2_i9:96-1526(-)